MSRAWLAAPELARAIATLGFDVAKIVQTWPLARQVQVAERAKQAAIVTAARP